MNCRNFLRYFSAYLDGELKGRALVESEAHLEGCKKCTRRLKAYHQGIEQLRYLPEIEPPVNLDFRVKQASLPGAPTISLRPRRFRFMIPATAAAVVVVALSITMIGVENKGNIAYEISPVDSTMDVVNLHLDREVLEKSATGSDRPQKKIRLASYAPDEDEPVLSYGVNPNPDIVLSGVAETGE